MLRIRNLVLYDRLTFRNNLGMHNAVRLASRTQQCTNNES